MIRTKPNQSRKTAVVHVLGCKVNQTEAWAMAQILRDRGYEVVSSSQHPDLIVINTCCVTSKAEGKSRRLINRLSRTFPGAQLVVTGCLAEVNPLAVEGVSKAVNVLGTFDKDHFESFVARGLVLPEGQERLGSWNCCEFVDMVVPGIPGIPGIPGRARAFLKIQDGCSHNCAYCIVPIARGPSRSLPIGGVKAHVQYLKDRGYGEIVLTGINLGGYGRDLTPSLVVEDLLQGLLEEAGDVRFRLSSIEPQDITPRLIELVAGQDRLCRHFHIPLQSGDDRILKIMGRPYNSASIKALTERILRHIPDACIGFDVMVGFPGEDQDAFRQTVQLIEHSGTSYLHVFPFSSRPGTAAASMGPKVPENVLRERVQQLRTLSRTLKNSFFQRSLGKTFKVIPESRPDPKTQTFVGRTDNYIPVRVQSTETSHDSNAFFVFLERIIDDEVHGICLKAPHRPPVQ